MDTRRQRRQGYSQAVRLGLLEEDMDTVFARMENMDRRQDSFDLWRVKVVTVVSIIAAVGAVVGGVVADVVARHFG